jgi:tRNA dimethylallyltransferase
LPAINTRDCWFLTGPTASGKTAVGVALARRIGAEIVSMDSMALYRGMDIGTAKPSARQRQAVRHHLLDVLEPHADYSLAQYLAAAAAAVAEIRGRGREVLFVGGTPLYLKGLLRGIFAGPTADWELRRRLLDEAREKGPLWLHGRLLAVDPAAAQRLHPNDTRRLLRAIEVFEKTGQPISRLQKQFDVGRPADQCRVFVLDWPAAQLAARIDRRVEAMFAAGLVEEVRVAFRSFRSAKGTVPFSAAENRDSPPAAENRDSPPAAENRDSPPAAENRDSPPAAENRDSPLGRTARQAVGYREVIEHLAGRRELAETIELVKLHTRQLAKRQRTWFRSLSECRFVPVTGQIDAGEVASQIAETGRHVID